MDIRVTHSSKYFHPVSSVLEDVIFQRLIWGLGMPFFFFHDTCIALAHGEERGVDCFSSLQFSIGMMLAFVPGKFCWSSCWVL